MLCKFVRLHKNDDLVEEVQLLDANPSYASIRFPDGRESSVSLIDLSPCPRTSEINEVDPGFLSVDEEKSSTPPLQSTDTGPESPSTCE